MANVDFVELAKYCQQKFKEQHEREDERYIDTLFVSIGENGSIKHSKTPHVLKDAYQCILVHQKSKLALKYWYGWYSVEFIDDEGCVHGINLDDNYKLYVSSWGSYSNQVMCLDYADNHLYWFGSPFEKKISQAWELYSKVKDIKNEAEIKLIAELYRKDEQIFELQNGNANLKFTNVLLEQEKQLYQGLLEEIKGMCDELKRNSNE